MFSHILAIFSTYFDKLPHILKQSMSHCLVKNEFSINLCEAFVTANIPLKKLNNPTLKNFLEKYMQRQIPDESTIGKNYLQEAYDNVIKKIREDIRESSIYVSVDETTDAELASDGPSKPYLIHVEHLAHTNAQTVAKTVNDALQILWKDGIKHGRVLLMVTDAAAYMKNMAKELKILYLKMVHITCLTHGLHNIADHICCVFPKVDSLVNNVKKIFLKAANRVALLKSMYPDLPLPPKPVITRWGTWLDAVKYYLTHFDEIRDVVLHLNKDDSLAISAAQALFQDDQLIAELSEIGEHYVFISESITKLENTKLEMTESLTIWSKTTRSILSAPNQSVREKMAKIIEKNAGLRIIEFIQSKNITELRKFDQFVDPKPNDLISFKFAPLVSVDVERSFSLYKQILSDYHRNFIVCN